LKTERQSWLIAPTLLAVFCFAAVPALALNPNLPPGQNFDLSLYKLQTPVTNNSGNGRVVEIFQPQLATFATNYFYTANDGAMVFWVPTAGVPITSNGYPRSELRQLLPGGDWVVTNNAVHLETATCKVLVQPPSGKTIIGQIHGTANDEVVKLEWANGTVQAAFKQSYGGKTFQISFGTWNLGDTLSYSIQQSNHLTTVTVNGVTVTNLLDSTWDVDTYYFKAGNYCQDNSTNTNTFCVVAFYALNTNILGSVGAPTFSPAADTYSSNQVVTIITPTIGTSIRYTIDGSTPTPTNGTFYTSPVSIGVTTTLRAIAYDNVGILPASTVMTGIYNIALPALGIKTSGTNVIISWPLGTDAGFALQSTTNLESTNWTSAGTPGINSGQFMVTNAIADKSRYYQLKY
jgi:hypothetical protein